LISSIDSFAQWVSTGDFGALASRVRGRTSARCNAKSRGGSLPPVSKAELVARLKAWRLRDHGRVAEIAHSAQALTEQQRSLLDAIGKERKAYATYDSPSAAFFPCFREPRRTYRLWCRSS